MKTSIFSIAIALAITSLAPSFAANPHEQDKQKPDLQHQIEQAVNFPEFLKSGMEDDGYVVVSFKIDEAQHAHVLQAAGTSEQLVEHVRMSLEQGEFEVADSDPSKEYSTRLNFQLR